MFKISEFKRKSRRFLPLLLELNRMGSSFFIYQRFHQIADDLFNAAAAAAVRCLLRLLILPGLPFGHKKGQISQICPF